MADQNPEEFYARLKEQLLENGTWPANYLSKQSKKGTYTSVSITVHMENPDAVIKKYKEVSHIEGVISL